MKVLEVYDGECQRNIMTVSVSEVYQGECHRNTVRVLEVHDGECQRELKQLQFPLTLSTIFLLHSHTPKYPLSYSFETLV